MYLDFYGLDNRPFKITPDTNMFFEGDNRGAILQALCFSVEQGEGIIKVVGEVGTGKTMLCRMLPLRLTRHIDWVYLANPSLSPEHILHAIAHELGIQVEDNTDKLVVMRKLHSLLLKRHAQNRRVVVLVEEAQGMPLESLEEIRLLSNLETDESKLLQIILFGQPELDSKLADQSIRQLKERITYSLYLPPFKSNEIHQYLNFRLQAVGYKGPAIFNNRIAKLIGHSSKGLTRRINIIADKALMIAYARGQHVVKPNYIKEAVLDSQFDSREKKPIAWSQYTLTAFFVLLLTLLSLRLLADYPMSSRVEFVEKELAISHLLPDSSLSQSEKN